MRTSAGFFGVLWRTRWPIQAQSIRTLNTRDTLPAPISISPSQNFDGIDGSWSTFTIQVGTPPQDLRVFLSTASQETWVVVPAGCPSYIPSCQSVRGGLFDNTTSSTYSYRNIYPLAVEDYLGLNTTAVFGNDTITLGVQGSGGPTLEQQIVGGLADAGGGAYWLGQFGVNPKSTNFSVDPNDLNNGQPSYVSNLKAQGKIPSLSFGYTAGNTYGGKGKVLGSLTLGGYDASKFQANDIIFTFAPDNQRDIVVGIQGVDAVDGDGTKHNLLGAKGITAYIDSTVPYIYLPLSACRLFEQAFGITYDTSSELYLLTDKQHTALLAQNPTITFTLGNTITNGPTTTITLPYAAFDLQITYPLVSNTTSYFPLKRGANETQFVLGRTFLQEAYLTVDWERQNFTVSQAVFDSTSQNLIPINPVGLATNSTSTPTPTPPKSSNTKTIGVAAGIAVLVILIIALALLFFCLRRRRTRKRAAATAAAESRAAEAEKADEIRSGFGKVELDTDRDHSRYELDEDGQLKPVITAADGRSLSSRGGSKDAILPELRGDDDRRPVPELHGVVPQFELYDPSAAPVELPAWDPRELHGSQPRSAASTPASRARTRSPVPRRQAVVSPLQRGWGGAERGAHRSMSRQPSGVSDGAGSTVDGSESGVSRATSEMGGLEESRPSDRLQDRRERGRVARSRAAVASVVSPVSPDSRRGTVRLDGGSAGSGAAGGGEEIMMRLLERREGDGGGGGLGRRRGRYEGIGQRDGS